ncbi:hypothetical protein K501DRAFT_279391 [Backusella circina FSU 941]|nr:hypothetical protein K501DRAFT_279391 [Backusella circina FSU 941]
MFPEPKTSLYIVKEIILKALLSTKERRYPGEDTSATTTSAARVLSYQVIGRFVIFYISTLSNDGLFILYELLEIAIPFTIDDLLKFTMGFGKLLLILDIYGEWCMKNTCTINRARKRLSMDDGDFGKLVDKVVNRKRECIIKHHQHSSQEHLFTFTCITILYHIHLLNTNETLCYDKCTAS